MGLLTINLEDRIHFFVSKLHFIILICLGTLGSRKAKLKNTTKKAKRSNNNTLDSDEDPIMV